MNANTALKINDAVAQAVDCGETRDEILAQANRAMDTAFRDRAAREQRELLRACEEYYGAQPGWLTA